MLIEYTTSYSLFCFDSDPFSVSYFDLICFCSRVILEIVHIFCAPFSRRIDSSTVFQLFT